MRVKLCEKYKQERDKNEDANIKERPEEDHC